MTRYEPIVSGYNSPINTFIQEITDELNKATDEFVLKEVVKVGITVDKEELIKALHYDRDQYIAGYKAGFEAGKHAGVLEFQAYQSGR